MTLHIPDDMFIKKIGGDEVLSFEKLREEFTEQRLVPFFAVDPVTTRSLN